MPVKEWFDYNEEELKEIEKQEAVFIRMLRILENEGKCRAVFHHLSKVLFGNENGEY